MSGIVTEREWESHGLSCRVVRITRGVLAPEWRCGYVHVPHGHPWYIAGDEWDDTLDVHGGITLRRPSGDVMVYGFDCAHFGDSMEEWTLDAVVAETERLAEQLSTRLPEEEES
jgi:hypothetical protein